MKPRETLRIAHISDLHFASPTLSPLQFFSKRWIGNLNQMISRYKIFNPAQLDLLPDLFTASKIDTVFITGDLTTTGLPQEFKRAADFVSLLQNRGLRVIAIPGNHDHYTKSAFRKKLFYHFFPDYSEYGFSLKEDGLAMIPLNESWTLLALDTACATPLNSSHGNFNDTIEIALKKALSDIPTQKNVIVMNHFPFFEHERPQKTLLRSDALRSIMTSHPNIRFYLHGHTHAHCLADLRASHYPILLDSGSTAQIKNATWNCLELTKTGASVSVHLFGQEGQTDEPAFYSFHWSAS